MFVTVGIATNAFKGSLTAHDAAQAIAEGLQASALGCKTLLLPLADGGDGTLEVMLSQPDSQRVTLAVEDALGDTIHANYGRLADGETAVVEMALASGLAILGNRRDALRASTYGTGQLIQHAISAGAKRVIVGVGGSATTDGGAGCLQAMGVQLLEKSEIPIERGGGTLHTLAQVIPNPALADIEILVLCDVQNPPLGDNGAAHIFSPQKGADAAQVKKLDSNLAHYFGVIAEQTAQDVRTLAGGGAAGALAGGLAALAGAKLVPGAETIIQTLGYADMLTQCDLIITGEGQLDAQTGQGKAPAVIAEKAAALGIPTVAIAGSAPPAASLRDTHIRAALSLVPRPASLEEAVKHAAEWLSDSAHHLGNILALHSNP